MVSRDGRKAACVEAYARLKNLKLVGESPGNWSLIDAALSAQPGGRSDD